MVRQLVLHRVLYLLLTFSEPEIENKPPTAPRKFNLFIGKTSFVCRPYVYIRLHVIDQFVHFWNVLPTLWHFLILSYHQVINHYAFAEFIRCHFYYDLHWNPTLRKPLIWALT